jgi:hypothetical protein
MIQSPYLMYIFLVCIYCDKHIGIVKLHTALDAWKLKMNILF